MAAGRTLLGKLCVQKIKDGKLGGGGIWYRRESHGDVTELKGKSSERAPRTAHAEHSTLQNQKIAKYAVQIDTTNKKTLLESSRTHPDEFSPSFLQLSLAMP